MKKITALLLAVLMMVAFVITGCDSSNKAGADTNNDNTVVSNEDNGVKSEGVMTYAEYMAADIDSAVVIEAYVQGKQSWWDDKATVYAQDKDGAYFLYNMSCSEEDYAKLTNGTKIKVSGYKSEWSGEIEIVDATFEIIEGNYVATAEDISALVGTDEIVNKQNQFVAVKGLTVTKIEYKGDPGTDDIYLTATLGETEFALCVEFYLTGSETDTYKAVQALAEGDVINVEGFLYWYNGAQLQITSVSK